MNNERNLDDVRGRIDFDRVDIRDFEALNRAMRDVDVVFHEAAIPSVPRSINDPVPSHEINIDGRIDAKKYGIERFRMMPAVGDSPAFIRALKDLVLQKLGISDENAELRATG